MSSVLHPPHHGLVEVEAGEQVVVVVGRDRHEADAARRAAAPPPRRCRRIASAMCCTPPPERPVALTCARGARALAERDVEHDAHAPLGVGDAARADQAEGVGELEAFAALQAEHGRRTAPRCRTGPAARPSAMWSIATRPASGTAAPARLGDEVGVVERRAARPSGTKWTMVPPGATIAGSCSSARRAGSRGAPKAGRRHGWPPGAGRPSPGRWRRPHGPCASKRVARRRRRARR